MEYNQNGTIFHYEREADEIRITGMEGDALTVRVPEAIEGKRVTVIGKKAFLSCIKVEEIYLPDSVYQLEDWAFASCKSLRMVSLKKGNIVFGRGTFRGCEALTEIRLREPVYDEEQPGLGYLFAAGFMLLDVLYLLDAQNAGTAEWYEKWDARMRVIMELPEQAGFSKMLLCGVEDYGSRENTLEYYISGNRKKKAEIALLRLLYPYGLKKKDRELLTDFLLLHTKGCDGEEAWEVLKDEHGDDAAYYKLFAGLGAVNIENCRMMIADLGESHTEMKAFLLKQCGNGQQDDFFDTLAL